MPREVVEDPKPLSAYEDFPYAAIAAPIRELVDYGLIPVTSEAAEPDPSKTSYEP